MFEIAHNTTLFVRTKVLWKTCPLGQGAGRPFATCYVVEETLKGAYTIRQTGKKYRSQEYSWRVWNQTRRSLSGGTWV